MAMNERKVKRGEDTPWNVVDDEVVLLNLDSGHYYSLNDLGRRIWELLDGNNKISDIVRTICEEFDAQREEVDKDVNNLIDELLKEGLASPVS